jgi:4a-hydroxytetrahydrobiopterin dehydratase
MQDLTSQKCEPCEGGVKPFDKKEAKKYLSLLKTKWELIEETPMKIRKKFKFGDFLETMKFVNKVADLAESEGHHPDFHISYSRLTITTWTHAINGLSVNDFILASKIDIIK